MKGLLIKDLYTLTKQFKVFLVLIVVFSLIPGYSMSAFALCYSAMLPITALAYDERSKWDKLAAMLPYSIKNIVLSKYVLGYICVAIAATISAVGKIGYSLFTHAVINGDVVADLLPTLCVALILQAFNLPFMFKLGVEKGRLIFFLTTAIIVSSGMFFSKNIVDLTSTLTADTEILALILIIVTIVINIISISISERLYMTRES